MAQLEPWNIQPIEPRLALPSAAPYETYFSVLQICLTWRIEGKNSITPWTFASWAAQHLLLFYWQKFWWFEIFEYIHKKIQCCTIASIQHKHVQILSVQNQPKPKSKKAWPFLLELGGMGGGKEGRGRGGGGRGKAAGGARSTILQLRPTRNSLRTGRR